MNAINEKIANAIVEDIEGGNGTFSVEVEIGDTQVFVDGSFETDGYCEDDYSNGTGAWVTTYATVRIESVEAYTDGDVTEITCDLTKIERYVEDELAA